MTSWKDTNISPFFDRIVIMIIVMARTNLLNYEHSSPSRTHTTATSKGAGQARRTALVQISHILGDKAGLGPRWGSACGSGSGWRPVRGTRVRHRPWLVGTFTVTRQCHDQSRSHPGIKGQGLTNWGTWRGTGLRGSRSWGSAEQQSLTDESSSHRLCVRPSPSWGLKE